MNDLIYEIDAVDTLLANSNVNAAGLKLAKIRVGIQKFQEDLTHERASAAEWKQKFQERYKRGLDVIKTLNSPDAQPGLETIKPKRGNGHRRKDSDI